MPDGSASSRGDDVCGGSEEELVAAYRHDVHKLRGRRHAAAHDEFLGVPVNQDVALGADGDAAVLSRPGEEPVQTVANHASPYRLSLLTGDTVVEGSSVAAATDDRVRELIASSDAERLHANWVTSDVAAVFNEAVQYPYTSLKFHVLLAAALLDNYRAGYEFRDLYVVVERGDAPCVNPGAGEVVASELVVPHRTVLWTPEVAVRVTGDAPGDTSAAKLGRRPSRSFAGVWSRLPRHPVAVDDERVWMVLDAQLRRIRSWSVALQYVEDFGARFGAAHRDRRTSGSRGSLSEVRES
jgi:hypothetical protein